MATDKTFKVAGISKLNGAYKVRFANDIMRIKVLAKSGHEDIRLAELDKEVTKLEAAQLIQKMDEFQDVIAQATIAEYLEDNAPKAPKAKVAPKAKAPAKAKSKAKVDADLEDAPF
jgi:uncharacterized protein YwgA